MPNAVIERQTIEGETGVCLEVINFKRERKIMKRQMKMAQVSLFLTLCCSSLLISQVVSSSSASLLPLDFNQLAHNQQEHQHDPQQQFQLHSQRDELAQQAHLQQPNYINHHHNQQQPAYSANFDASTYKSVHDAIQAHPDLREFANLCQAEGVKEIVGMDKTPLTVFAPTDKALSELLIKSKSRNSINLIELAKHHVAQGFITPDENTKFPHQFGTYSNLSPLYLVQQQQQQPSAFFVNNAKILATYLIPIDEGDNYQALHLIDSVLEFAYSAKRTQLKATKGKKLDKRALSFDDLTSTNAQDYQQALMEFNEKFGDYQTNQSQVDLFHARAFNSNLQQSRIQLTRDELNFDKLAKYFRQQPQLRGKFYQLNETNSLNTYFLPIQSDELDSILDLPQSILNPSIFEAFIIPNEVLFTRTMALGQSHATLLSQTKPQAQRVSLNLAKTLPLAGAGGHEYSDSFERRFLATPLLLQTKCSGGASASAENSAESATVQLRAGITSTEIVLANIPLGNGVLHLIKKPTFLASNVANSAAFAGQNDGSSILDYINDHDNQLSNVVNSLGSGTLAEPMRERPVKLNKFRELLARERSIVSQLADQLMNKTILAPSDEAISKLRFDLRALITNDESLIPKHWDMSYRQDLLQRIARRHVILRQTLTTDQMEALASNQQQQQPEQRVLSENGKLLQFSRRNNELEVESDGTKAQLIHSDLIGSSNGVLHIIDRVLGEEQETIDSLLKSIVVKYNSSISLLPTEESSSGAEQLSSIIQANIRNLQGKSQGPDLSGASSEQSNSDAQQQRQRDQQSQANNLELRTISSSIGQYLNDLETNNRRQLQLLASSVNISYQLAKLTSLAEGLDDWNDKFKQENKLFTYFVPSDLAWFKLQQQQPELYKPLMHFLEAEQNLGLLQQESSQQMGDNSIESSAGRSMKISPKSSESSHRLRQILNRHLVVNRKITKKDLNQMDSLQTLGATLRLIEAPTQQSLTADYTQGSQQVALHSSAGNSPLPPIGASSEGNHQQFKFKTIKLDSINANIIQANEACNGFLYIIDNVLLLPDDSDYIVQTSQSAASSSTMSSLLGGHNSILLDFLNSLLSPTNYLASPNSLGGGLNGSAFITIIATLSLAIAILLILALILIVRKSRRTKLNNHHQQLESGLTSSSSANSGSTSTTKSL